MFMNLSIHNSDPFESISVLWAFNRKGCWPFQSSSFFTFWSTLFICWLVQKNNNKNLADVHVGRVKCWTRQSTLYFGQYPVSISFHLIMIAGFFLSAFDQCWKGLSQVFSYILSPSCLEHTSMSNFSVVTISLSNLNILFLRLSFSLSPPMLLSLFLILLLPTSVLSAT